MILRRIALLCTILIAPAAVAQETRRAGDNPKAVLPSFRRADSIKKAGEFLEIKPADSEALVAEIVDPFNPQIKRSKEKKPGAVEPVVAVDPEVLLSRAADSIRPQGTMLIGDEPYLLLDGKRYKAGDIIPVTVDGVGVQVTVTSIQRNSYTLRLDDKELRRDFK